MIATRLHIMIVDLEAGFVKSSLYPFDRPDVFH